MGALPRDPGRRMRRERLEAQAWGVLCPACGAQPGEPCRTETEGVRKAHPVRIRLSTYLPVPAVPEQ